MANEIVLETTAPGLGQIRIKGATVPEEDWRLTIQRSSDGQYLGPGEAWQSAIHWHRPAPIRFEADEVLLEADSGLLHGIGHCARNNKFRVAATDGRVEQIATLRIEGALTLKGAGSDRSTPPEPPPARIEPEPEPEIETPTEPPRTDGTEESTGTAPDEATNPEEQTRPADEPAATASRDESTEREPRTKRRVLLIVLSMLLIAAIAGAAWYLYDTASEPRPDRQPPVAKGNDVDKPPIASGPTDVEEGQERADAPTGRARARAVLDRGLNPAEIYAEAERANQDADCDAALLLYREAASSDPAVAGQLARSYDPEGFSPSPCIPEPNPDSAEVNYGTAAKADDPHAQRRLGEMLIEEYASGPIHEDGIKWLRKAARAGDQAAADRLRELGED